MVKKKKDNSYPDTQKQNYHIEGGIIAGRDVIQGNQTNYFSDLEGQARDINSQSEFIAALQQIQVLIADIQKTHLSVTQTRNLDRVESLVKNVELEAQKPAPVLEHIKMSLLEAKETLDLLSGAMTSAATLGTTIGILVTVAIRLFGG